MVTGFGDETLVFIILLLLFFFFFCIDFVEVMVYLLHICFNYSYKCLATALFSLSCFSIFRACMPFQRLGFEDRFREGLMAKAFL